MAVAGITSRTLLVRFGESRDQASRNPPSDHCDGGRHIWDSSADSGSLSPFITRT